MLKKTKIFGLYMKVRIIFVFEGLFYIFGHFLIFLFEKQKIKG
jgi:hypothetical protein